MKSISIQLSECLEIAQKALLSNKADTENAIELFGAALEEIERIKEEKEELENKWDNHLKLDFELEKRFQNSYSVGNFLVPLIPISLLTTSTILMLNDQKEMGKYFLYASGISLVGLELVYQGGHWIFKIW